MSDIAIAQLNATDLSESERDRARNFIAADASSPLSVFLQRVLAAASEGMSLNVLADDAELTPNQAATLLKMSRPHLLTFMDRGDLPFHRVGTHRRIKMKDLMDFMFAREAGAEILANALNRPTVKLTQPPTLTREDIDELNDL
ncbi:helix-turn-helix domain-containing protein [Brachybacterium alimentarium]|uniref:helix-turn-helix domain-containing protein n=1 Tax=Brachybacterium alimentarium TaxID=47845 RepID=UPI003FCF286B